MKKRLSCSNYKHVGFANLPSDVLNYLSQRYLTVNDLIKCSQVCKGWYHALKSIRFLGGRFSKICQFEAFLNKNNLTMLDPSFKYSVLSELPIRVSFVLPDYEYISKKKTEVFNGSPKYSFRISSKEISNGIAHVSGFYCKKGNRDVYYGVFKKEIERNGIPITLTWRNTYLEYDTSKKEASFDNRLMFDFSVMDRETMFTRTYKKVYADVDGKNRKGYNYY
ncbi:hypothetical protein DID78_01480 [Candidatus Marinamargulisbacteria bacterium SCGC AG-343-D04]|nr:hypothetical protein DID78_01480 [Candidatus Marinamargulisbacteria bacterium SCGC AG-343-D04]